MTDINPQWDEIPDCQHCGKPMRLNAAVSSKDFKQYICSCIGELCYFNVHKGQIPKEDKH